MQATIAVRKMRPTRSDGKRSAIAKTRTIERRAARKCKRGEANV